MSEIRPNCYNRQPFKDTVVVQDGWEDYEYRAAGKPIGTSRRPRMKVIPDPMSKGCHQHGPMGEALLHPEKWNCEGCRWKPEKAND